MNRLLVIGAGGFGREVLDWANQVDPADRDWRVGGFLDANPRALDGYACDLRILSDPMAYRPALGDRFVCAIGDPVTKLRLCRELKSRGAQFITLVHPTALIGSACQIGEGCIVCPGAVITTNVVLGDFVTVNVMCCVGHDARIGTGSTLSPHVDVTGNASLGAGVFVGSHATIIPGVSVGNNAVVGAGCVVLRRVSPGTTVMGPIAKQIAGFDKG